MILRRMTHHMKSESWTSVAIEFVLVVLGVFLGILAANWNEKRLEKRETEELLEQLDTELTGFVTYIDGLRAYYDSVEVYSDRAKRGWAGDPAISDTDFVIAAYQASQINAVGNNNAAWSAIFGAGNLRDIDDPVVREALARVMTFDYALVDLRSVSTPYREEVRKVIPDDVQAAIRRRCGDRPMPGNVFALPATCELRLDPALARRTAEALRARPSLAAELNWHQAAVDNQLANTQALREFASTLANRVGDPLQKEDE